MSILTDKIEALENIPDEWSKAIQRFEPRLLNELNRLASRLTLTSEGLIELTADNLNRVATIISELSDYMTTGEYRQIVQELDSAFMQQQATTVAYFEQTFGEAPVTSFASTLYNTKRLTLLEAVIGDGLSPQLYTPVRNALIDAIGTGASYEDTLTNLRQIAVGLDGEEGNLQRFSRLIVSDTLATTDRQFTQIIGDELGLQWYRYLGGVIDTTRCFCKERNRGYFHREEVMRWGECKDIGDCRSGDCWQGMRKGTNSETIFVYLGGYNCQHSLIPTSTFDVPKNDIKRAFNKGYYKPTTVEKDFFNL
jgi:hypothetical protein